MKRIDNYQKFLERLGIPSGNLELAEEIYNYIISNLDRLSTEKSNIIPGPFQISDFGIERVILDFNLMETEQVNKPILVSAALQSISQAEGIYQVFEETNHLTIIFNIAIPLEFGGVSDLSDFFQQERSQILSTLSHELKHGYDHFKLGKCLSIEIGDYQAFSEIRFGLPGIDTFLFLTYFSSKIETSVYTSELGSLLRSNNVTADEFKEFITNTRIYDFLHGLEDFNYDDLFNTILSNIDNLRTQLERDKPVEEELPTGDRELTNYVLDLIVKNITQHRIASLVKYLPKKEGGSPFLDMILGIQPKLKDGLEDYLVKISNQITFKNNRDFFEFWEKRFKFVASKMKKKLAKLYDMCPTKKNLLHQKINQKSIVNPELYDKLITKTPLYPKK